tara:strand:- start:7723 stop:9084 length:1362 start_codon:yes stop_codon:yes gene_type:complete
MLLNEELQQKWQPVLEHEDLPEIKDSHKRAVIATLLENQERDAREQAGGTGGYNGPQSLLEAAPTNQMGASSSTAGDGNVDIFDPVLISLIRRSAPNLVAFDLMGVQPMTGPTGLIFAMRSRYTNQTGTEALFNEANTTFSAAAAGNTAAAVAANNQTGSSPVEATIDGSTYTAATAMSTALAERLGENTAHDFPEMAFSIEKITVTALSRALKAEYTMELAQDLRAVHGLDAETELSNILSTEILAEINREMVRKINISATIGAQENVATAGTFDLDQDANGRWSIEKFKGLMFQLEREANAIAKATRRGKGNVIVCSSDVASALNMAGTLDTSPALNNTLTSDDTGNTFVGVLNGRFRVYIDPYFAAASGVHYATVGYKGSSPFDAGVFYCPYVPLQMVRAIGENTFQPKIGFKTRYGLVANPFATSAADGVVSFANKNSYYRIFQIANLM